MKALVLGAGIQGCCVSLMLKKHGYEVSLVDKSNDIFNRASLNQEGKIHLGFVYGLDSSLKTGKKLLLDALHFAPYLEYLLDRKINWNDFKSSKFNYLVAKDSMLSSTQIDEYFQKLQDYYRECLKDEKLSYLGQRPQRLFQKTSLPQQVNPDFFQACFATQEVALQPENLKEIIKQKIQSQNITLYLNQNIIGIKKTRSGFIVETCSNNDTSKKHESDFVFNCLWEGRISLDKEMGIKIQKGYNFRFKHGIITKPQASLSGLDSFTILQGPYGDYVNYPKNNKTYFCWYPSSTKEMIIDQSIPKSWEEACEGQISSSVKEKLVKENFIQFHRLLPTLQSFEDSVIKGGVIVAKGHHDINQIQSLLHQRNELPINQNDGYFSINTSKFTSAPHNTLLLEHLLV